MKAITRNYLQGSTLPWHSLKVLNEFIRDLETMAQLIPELVERSRLVGEKAEVYSPYVAFAVSHLRKFWTDNQIFPVYNNQSTPELDVMDTDWLDNAKLKDVTDIFWVYNASQKKSLANVFTNQGSGFSVNVFISGNDFVDLPVPLKLCQILLGGLLATGTALPADLPDLGITYSIVKGVKMTKDVNNQRVLDNSNVEEIGFHRYYNNITVGTSDVTFEGEITVKCVAPKQLVHMIPMLNILLERLRLIANFCNALVNFEVSTVLDDVNYNLSSQVGNSRAKLIKSLNVTFQNGYSDKGITYLEDALDDTRKALWRKWIDLGDKESYDAVYFDSFINPDTTPPVAE